MAVGKGSIQRAVKANSTVLKAEPMKAEPEILDTTKTVILEAPIVEYEVKTSFVTIGNQLPSYLL